MSMRATSLYFAPGAIREIQQDAVPSHAVQYALQRLPGWLEEEKPRNPQQDSRRYDYYELNIDAETVGITRSNHLFVFALHTYFSIQFHKLALETQSRALDNEIKTAQTKEEWVRKEEIFSFDFSSLQMRLFPAVFDSKAMQEQVNKRNGATESRKFYFPIDGQKLKEQSEGREQEEINPKWYLFVREESKNVFVCDMLHHFYQALSRPTYAIESAFSENQQRVMLNMQDCALFVCCNWEVQEQIHKAILERHSPDTFLIQMRDISKGQEDDGAFVNTFFSYLFWYLARKGAPDLLGFSSLNGSDGKLSVPENFPNDADLPDFVHNCIELENSAETSQICVISFAQSGSTGETQPVPQEGGSPQSCRETG